MSLAVVKLGGSTAADTRLFEWINALAAAGTPLVVVPGGGPFAEQVRETQVRIGFSDKAAHAMAIHGMDQFGLMLCDLCRRFSPARLEHQLWQVLKEGNIPVWLPSAMTIERSDIPASWDVTSDSLAAWLAGRLRADTLLLIKQSRDIRADDDVTALERRGIIDASLVSLLPSSVRLLMAGPDHVTDAASLMAQGSLPGLCIAHSDTASQMCI